VQLICNAQRTPVLNGFGHMGYLGTVGAGQIGNGAGYFP
jgi:hypothetical protein